MNDTSMTEMDPTGQKLSAMSPPTVLDAPIQITETVSDAVIAPMTRIEGLPCGVFRADGSFSRLSRTRISDDRFTDVPKPPLPRDIQDVEGRFLFAGIGRHHFGHFLMECIGRLWALEDAHDNFDGVVIVPMHSKDIDSVMRRRFLPLYRALSYNVPVYLVQTPVRIPELVVPSQAFGHMSWSEGTPEFRQFVRDRLESKFNPDGPEKLYISRRALKQGAQRIDQEAQIEAMLRSAGYTIFHPQKHTIEVQCQHYMAARHIVGGDGSAFHLAPFVMQPGTRVGLIQRRHRRNVFDALCRQINAFSNVDLTAINPLMPLKLAPGRDNRQPAPIDFDRLSRALAGADLI